ncbi:uncharacterized protein LOC116290855 isoform X2 [Actinia tenebrosa]|uniref:Uncharacterized protein LOC116290855 isoform X2 n=1 Tax=Actinia tenebrosa TaxID=6105 RepID=A0A6P8HBM0_ACTTE|nr:uncharacterized protein LOC116290855 isoform X2 [Actinia tenebrosa]
MRLYSSIVLILLSLTPLVWSHGYTIDPASRNACWRVFSESCPVNYNDNEQNCGGRDVQISLGGKCGVCGDKYGENIHVHPGKYAKGFITKTYKRGQEITVQIHITSNHKGWFEFRVGKIGNPPITQEKLRYLLKSPQGNTRYPLGGSGPSDEYVKLMLPPGLTCDHCVLQWWWKVGNSWGCDDEGCGLGHGDQETFVNCADIKITNTTTSPGTTITPGPTTNTTLQPVTTQTPPRSTTGDGGVTPNTTPPPGTTITPGPTTNTPPKPATTQTPPQPTTQRPRECKAVGAWIGQSSVDQWCVINCAAGFCPSVICICN